MNPWQFLRREIDGAARSMRYDFNLRRARRQMNEETRELPIIDAHVTRRRRLILASGGVLVATAAVSGYLAVGSSIDALVGGDGDPASLPNRPGHPHPAPSPAPPPAGPSPTPAAVTQVNLPVTEGSPVPQTPHATPSSPTGTPPVPTPAPTCTCVSPSPSVSPSMSPSPSASSSPSTSASPAAQPATQPAAQPAASTSATAR